MSLAYILLLHRNPEQAVRLVRRLATPTAQFLIHVDRRSPDEVFEAVAAGLADQPRVRFLRRHKVYWAGFGHVHATLEAIEALAGAEYSHAVLLTGQDYPIKPVAEIERFLAENPERSYLDFARLPSPRWANGGLDRLTSRHWHGELLGRRVRVPNRLVPLRIPRRIPPGLEPHGGHAYWCLTRACVDYVREFARTRPRDTAFFERGSSPDETFFQTVLLSSPLRDSIVNDDLRYIDWSERRPSPKTLTRDDLPALEASHALFARKFDPAVDAEVLDLLDARAGG